MEMNEWYYFLGFVKGFVIVIYSKAWINVHSVNVACMHAFYRVELKSGRGSV